jgi:hypothetical protein
VNQPNPGNLEPSAVVTEVIGHLMRDDWYKVAGHLRHLELAFPAEYEAARTPWLTEKSERDQLVRALESARAETASERVVSERLREALRDVAAGYGEPLSRARAARALDEKH